MPMHPAPLLAALLAAPVAAHAEEAPRMTLLETFADEFVEITPGRGRFPKTFTMGRDGGREDERPARRVALEHDFAIAKYEVPQNLYEAVMGENPSRWKGPRNSVEMMTWAEANEFCSKVTRRLREADLLPADEEVRLPTEAEWEYACRAGTQTVYSFGDEAQQAGDGPKQASLLDPYGWHTGNAAGNDPPVGAKRPNPWGLYDVHGYLWELTSDPWAARGADDADPPQAARPVARVARGGSWKDRHDRLTSTARLRVAARVRDDALGFRCVRAKVPSP